MSRVTPLTQQRQPAHRPQPLSPAELDALAAQTVASWPELTEDRQRVLGALLAPSAATAPPRASRRAA